jgi:hypothetical protein
MRTDPAVGMALATIRPTRGSVMWQMMEWLYAREFHACRKRRARDARHSLLLIHVRLRRRRRLALHDA